MGKRMICNDSQIFILYEAYMTHNLFDAYPFILYEVYMTHSLFDAYPFILYEAYTTHNLFDAYPLDLALFLSTQIYCRPKTLSFIRTNSIDQIYCHKLF
jgi:hypothetical protein